MNLSHKTKILIGIATLAVVILPFLLAMGWMAMMFLPFFPLMAEGEEGLSLFMGTLFVFWMILMPLFMCMGILSLALRIFYIIHVIKNEHGDDTLRILCAVGFMFMPYFAYPIYYFLYIWPETPPPSALKPAYRPVLSENNLIGANS